MLRRLLDVRAVRDGKRISTRPVAEGRIRRVMAVASSALSGLVPDTLPTNPARVKAGKVRRKRPLLVDRRARGPLAGDRRHPRPPATHGLDREPRWRVS